MTVDLAKLAERVNLSYLVTLNKDGVTERHLSGDELAAIVSALRTSAQQDGVREALANALEDMVERVEASWERRDLAPDSDLEAVERARKLLAGVEQIRE